MQSADERFEWIAVDWVDNPFDSFTFAFEYWTERRGDAWAPPWSTIDLMDFPPRMIANCNVVDITHDPFDARYRFFGTGICNLHGSDLTGKSIQANEPPAFRQVCFETFEALVERREPLSFIASVPVRSSHRKRHHFLRLPLSDDGVTLSGAITFEEFGENREELRAYYVAMSEIGRSKDV